MTMTEPEVQAVAPRTMGELHEEHQGLRMGWRDRPRSNAVPVLRLRSRVAAQTGIYNRAMQEEQKAAKRAKRPWLRLLPAERKKAKAEYAQAKALRESSEKALQRTREDLRAAEERQAKHRQWKQENQAKTGPRKALTQEGLKRQKHLGKAEAERLKHEAPQDPVKRAMWERDLGRKAAREEWGLVPGQDVLQVRAERRKMAQAKRAEKQTRNADRTVRPHFSQRR